MSRSRSRRMIFVSLLPLLSLPQFSSAGFSTIYSSVGGASSVNHYQQPLPQQSQVNTWTQYPLDPQPPSTYLPQQQQQQQQQPQIQYQVQHPPAPLITAGGLQLSPLPTQSIFKSQQPISFNLAGQNSFFYSPQDQALYKVTKISLHGANGVGATGAEGEKGKLEYGYGPPPPPLPTTTTTTTTTPEPETVIDLLPPTPPPAPTPPPSNLRPYYNTRPTYRINFTVFESSPNEGVRCGSGAGGGGGEGMNPALTPTFGADAAPAGCPPVPPPAGDSPQFGVPVPVSEDPDSPSSLAPSPSQSQFQVPGEVGVPSTSYGPPSQYGPPPPKYGALPKPTIRPDDGIAGTGTRGNTNGQTNGVSFTADGSIG